MPDISISDYGSNIEAAADQFIKKQAKTTKDNLAELIDQTYYQGSDDKADEVANHMFPNMFYDIIQHWIDNLGSSTPDFDRGLTQATITGLQIIADTASSNVFVNDEDFDEAYEYFVEHYGDTEPEDLLNKIKDILGD